MSSFTDPLFVEVLQKEVQGRGKAKLIKPFTYHVGSYPSSDIIIVKADHETDFASIPKLLMPILPVMGKASKAAVIHDYLLDEGIRPRKECDAIFLEAMGVLEVPPLRKYAMWFGVRIYGILKNIGQSIFRK